MDIRKKPRSYEVGYGRPPVENRFKPGQSGNPGGRPAQKQDLTTRIGKKLATKRTVIISGNQTKLSVEDILIERLIERAAKGDMKALLLLLGESQKYQNNRAKIKTAARPILSREEIKKLTEQERVDLYMKCLKRANGTANNTDNQDE